MTKETVVAQKSLRINTNIYRPGEKVTAKDLAKLPTEEREQLFADGKLAGEARGETAGENDPPAETTKDSLMSKTKAFTEHLLEEAGIDKAEWQDLNKEPLVDFYLEAANT